MRHWLRLLSFAVAAGVACMPVPGAWGVSVFALVAAGWGYFVRAMEGRSLLHEKVDTMNQNVSAVLTEMRGDRHLHLVGRGRQS
jgi:hypothetical protein